MSATPRILMVTILSLLTTSSVIGQESGDTPTAAIDAAKHASLQAALDALPPSGGIVRLAPMTYKIKEPLIVRTPETRLEGAGPATHIVNLNEEGKPAFHIRPDDYADDSSARIWRVQLGNFRISGNQLSGDGVLAQGIQEIFVHGLSVDHHGGNGISLVDCYEDPRISDSILTYNAKAGLHILRGHDIVVNANHFEENQDGVQCLDSFNLTCNANNFDDHLGNGIVIENTYGSVCSANMIEECNGIAVILNRDCYGITLSSNVIAHDMQGGIDLRDAWGCTVSANTFVLVHQFGVRVSKKSGRIAITGNNFSNSYIGSGKHKRKLEHENPLQLDAGAGVVLEDTESIAISGNVFAGLDAEAVSGMDGSSNVVFVGNVVTDFGRRKSVKRAIAEAPEGSVSTSNIGIEQ